jgi:hypothetical protein
MKMKRLVSLALSAVMPLSMLLTQQLDSVVAADGQMLTEADMAEYEELKALRAEAIDDYNKFAKEKVTATKHNDPDDLPQIKVLFVEMKHTVTPLGDPVDATEEDDMIFNAVPEQFENLVEYLSEYNVDVVTDVLIIDKVIYVDGWCPARENIEDYLDKEALYGEYDSIITYTPEHAEYHCPNSSSATFNPVTGTSYCWCPIAYWDHVESTPDSHSGRQHYYSVDLAIHEWEHSLEVFRDLKGADILMPSADISGLTTGNHKLIENKTKYEEDNYIWDFVWPEDKVNGYSEEFIQGREPLSISYAHGMLTGTLWDKNNERYVGMFPSFWKFYGGRTFFGEYLAQDENNDYVAFLGRDTSKYYHETVPEYDNPGFIWKVYYSVVDDVLSVRNKKIYTWVNNINSTILPDCVMERVTFDNQGDNYIINKATGDYLLYDKDKNAVTFAKFDKTKSDLFTWSIKAKGSNVYTISPKLASDQLFDVANAWDCDDNPVGLHGSSGYPTAQSVIFREQTDGSYTIYPLLSGSRCLTQTSDGLVINPDTHAYDQKWIIKPADGKAVDSASLVTTTAAATTTPKTTTTAVPTTTKPAPTTTKPVPTTVAPTQPPTKPVTTTAAPTKPVVIKGDVNDDHMVSVADLVVIQRFLLGNGKLKNSTNADINADKRVDTFDLIFLRRMMTDTSGI